MRRWWQHRRLRIHLTLWYVSAMVVVLSIYAAGVLVFVSRRASASLDSRIRADYVWAAEMWDRREDGSLTWYDSSGLTDEDSPWLRVWSAAGDLLFSTSAARRSPIPTSDALARQADGQIVPVRSTRPAYRLLSRAATIDGQPVVIQVAQSEALIRAELSELGFLLLVGLPVGVAAAGLGGYALARRALKPVDRMAERARSITAARLDERLPVDEPNDELGRLATVFNQTLARLEGAFGQMARFTHVEEPFKSRHFDEEIVVCSPPQRDNGEVAEIVLAAAQPYSPPPPGSSLRRPGYLARSAAPTRRSVR